MDARHPRCCCRLVAGLVLVAWLGSASCASTPRTSRLQVEDIQEMSAEMAASLNARFNERDSASEPWVVSIEKVQNLSDDILTVGEQWYPMVKLTRAQPTQELWDRRRIMLVIPPERWEQLRRQSPEEFDVRFGAERRPTHVVTATLRSALRAGGKARTDLYYAEFSMIDLATGRPVWNDRFELKRQALGAVWD